MNLILLGAPGSGKGTEASLISKEFNILAISTGDIIRDNIKNNTEIGLMLKDLIANGELVPDELMTKLLMQRLNQNDVNNGFILDGFPRTIAQAYALENIININYVIYIDVDYEIIKDRILTRRVCPNCKSVYSTKDYHYENCKVCGEKLIVRDDDNEESLKNRYQLFNSQTKPIVDYYDKKHILYKVNGNQAVEKVFLEIKKILQNEGKI